MFHHDDHQTATLGDRVIAAVIGGLCGYLIGSLAAYIAVRFLGETYGLPWWVSGAFAAFAFLAPARSRELWSEFWRSLLGLFSHR